MNRARSPHAARPPETRRVVKMALVLIALAAGLLAPAQARADPAPSQETIFASLGVDKISADYVILVDTSGSMAEGNLYGSVKATLRPFLAGLSPADYVAIYTYDNTPEVRYLGSPADPDGILSRLPAGPTPGGATDIGAAIEKALQELGRAEASPVASVVLLTDGKHEPPADSRYQGTTSKPWQDLTDRAAKLRKSWLGAYALPLRGNTGADLLRQVIPQTQVLDPASVQQLGAYLDRSKQETRLAKAREALAGDIGKGVRVEWSEPTVDRVRGTADLPMTLRAETVRAPLTVDGLTLGADKQVEVDADVPRELTLQPGEARELPVRLRWQPSGLTWPWPQPSGLTWPWPHDQEIMSRLTLAGSVQSPWSAPLEPDVPLNIDRALRSPSTKVPMSLPAGSWLAVAVLIGLVVLFVLTVLVISYLRSHLRLPAGVLVVSSVDRDEELARVPLNGRGVVADAPEIHGRADIHGGRIAGDPRGRNVELNVELRIKFVQDDGRVSESTCPPGGSVIIGGLNFTHVPPGHDPMAIAQPARNTTTNT